MSDPEPEHDYLPSPPQRKKPKLPPWMNPVTTLCSPSLDVKQKPPMVCSSIYGLFS
jgi:hypothetical protein